MVVARRLPPRARVPRPRTRSRTATPGWSGPPRTPPSSASTRTGIVIARCQRRRRPGRRRRTARPRPRRPGAARPAADLPDARRPQRHRLGRSRSTASACGTARSNVTGWNALLGDRRGTDDVSIYAAPARAEDLSGLPPAFIDVGSAEVFRDEDVAYASRHLGGRRQAELHVWPGGFHGFDGFAPQAQVSIAMVDTRNRWLARCSTPEPLPERSAPSRRQGGGRTGREGEAHR